MTLGVSWHPEAEAEFDAEVNWYEHRDTGLGDRFEADVFTAVDESVDTSEAWPPWPGWERQPTVRSKGVTGFPYRVVYFVHDDLLTVVAVARAKRRPGYWRDRVRS